MNITSFHIGWPEKSGCGIMGIFVSKGVFWVVVPSPGLLGPWFPILWRQFSLGGEEWNPSMQINSGNLSSTRVEWLESWESILIRYYFQLFIKEDYSSTFLSRFHSTMDICFKLSFAGWCDTLCYIILKSYEIFLYIFLAIFKS